MIKKLKALTEAVFCGIVLMSPLILQALHEYLSRK